MDDVLIHKTPQTDFEKLIWERHMNKGLMEELKAQRLANGMLQSEIDEVNHKMKELKDRMLKDQVGIVVLKNNRLKQLNDDKDKKIKTLKTEKEELMQTVIKLQNPVLFKDNVEERAG